jgi:CRISPR/Cas system-associated protein endoribonuclease Cas2
MEMQDFLKARKKADVKFWTDISELQDGILMLYYTLYTKGQVGLKELNKEIKRLLEIEIEVSKYEL